MDILETEFLESENLKPWCWKRYIDDIFFVWTHGKESLTGFLDRLNKFHPTINFTHVTSEESVNFLDTQVSIKNNEFSTSLYCKPTDCHQYLHFDSCHPYHTKKSTIYSQSLRVKKICSENEDCDDNLQNLKKWFQDRGYPTNMIENELQKVSEIPRDNLFKEKQRDTKNAVAFVVDYCPALQSLPKLIKSLYFIIDLDPETKAVFPEVPFVSFRNCRNLKSYLVRAKLYPEIDQTPGSAKCGSAQCRTCDNVTCSQSFTSSVSKDVFKINHQLDCNSNNIVYLFTCKVCNLQYVGQTCNKFRYRWNNYKFQQRKASKGEIALQNTFHQHFLSEGHHGLEEDCEITFIDKTDAHSPTERENFWIEMLKTMSPKGLNTIDDNIF